MPTILMLLIIIKKPANTGLLIIFWSVVRF
jgi:hypothetical protein